MSKNIIPKSLLVNLKKQGYSDEVIKELYKWYASSEKKGVTNF